MRRRATFPRGVGGERGSPRSSQSRSFICGPGPAGPPALGRCGIGPIVPAVLSACSEPSPGPAGLWMETLPEQARNEILYVADMEEGDLSDRHADPHRPDLAGGGVFTTPSDAGGSGVDAAWTARASTVVAHSGRYGAEATIRGAVRAENGNRAVRLMRWTDKPWDQDGEYFPAQAY